MAVPRGPMRDDKNFCSELKMLGVLHTLHFACGMAHEQCALHISPDVYCCDAYAATKGSDSLPAHLEVATSCR